MGLCLSSIYTLQSVYAWFIFSGVEFINWRLNFHGLTLLSHSQNYRKLIHLLGHISSVFCYFCSDWLMLVIYMTWIMKENGSWLRICEDLESRFESLHLWQLRTWRWGWKDGKNSRFFWTNNLNILTSINLLFRFIVIVLRLISVYKQQRLSIS